MRGSWKGWIGRLVGSARRADSDLEEELSFHLEGRVEELVAEGWDREEAAREVRRRFGDVESVRERCREIDRRRRRRARRGERLDGVLRDARFALRSFGRSPVFTLVSLLTLGLGIGATTAVFSVVDGVLFEALPYEGADRLVLVWEQNLSQEIPKDRPSPPNFVDWRKGNRTFEAMAAMQSFSATLTDAGEAEVLDVAAVSDNLFRMLGVRAIAGRGFAEGEGAYDTAPVAVLSHGLWTRKFGADPDVVGRTLSLDGGSLEIVGVAPPDFDVPSEDVDVWISTNYDSPQMHRQSRYLTVLGRLAEGVDEAGAEEDLDRIQAAIAVEDPAANKGWTVDVVPAKEELVGETRPLLLALLGAVGTVLLIACANVASLQLARSVGREGELAVRVAMGADRGRLRTMLVTESVVLGVLGGAFGTGLAWLGVRLLRAFEPVDLPRLGEVGVDLRVLGFALGVSVLSALVFGLVPALRFGREAPGAALRKHGRGSGVRGTTTRRAMVVGEVALSLVLLAGAALLLRSVSALAAQDPGFRPEGVHTGRLSIPEAAYPSSAERIDYFQTVRRRVEARPEIGSAAVASTLPMDPAGTDFDLPYRADHQPPLPESELPQVDYRIVSPGYLETMGIPLLRGRTFEGADGRNDAPVMLVNESFADELWRGEDPVGRSITVHYVDDAGIEWRIVGVVADTRHQGLGMEPRRQMYVPLAQAEYVFGYMQLAAREAWPGADVAGAVREAVLDVDPAHPVYEQGTMEDVVAATFARERFGATVLGLFAALALILAAVGIQGMVAYQVVRRTREIGLRMALGEDRRKVVTQVVGEAVLLAGVGVALGLLAAPLGTRALESSLYGVEPVDPISYAAGAVVLPVAATVAAWAPARRAARVDPAVALRAD